MKIEVLKTVIVSPGILGRGVYNAHGLAHGAQGRKGHYSCDLRATGQFRTVVLDRANLTDTVWTQQSTFVVSRQTGPSGKKGVLGETPEFFGRDVFQYGCLCIHIPSDVLADSGIRTLADSLLLRADYSHGHIWTTMGLPTIWETWSGDVVSSKKKMVKCHRILMIRSICGFLFRRVAGIDQLGPGFKRLLSAPYRPACKARRCRLRFVMGRISTNWMQALDGTFTLDVAIPANTRAHVYLPNRRIPNREGGRDSRLARYSILSRSDHKTLLRSIGSYHFVVHA